MSAFPNYEEGYRLETDSGLRHGNAKKVPLLAQLSVLEGFLHEIRLPSFIFPERVK